MCLETLDLALTQNCQKRTCALKNNGFLEEMFFKVLFGASLAKDLFQNSIIFSVNVYQASEINRDLGQNGEKLT